MVMDLVLWKDIRGDWKTPGLLQDQFTSEARGWCLKNI